MATCIERHGTIHRPKATACLSTPTGSFGKPACPRRLHVHPDAQRPPASPLCRPLPTKPPACIADQGPFPSCDPNAASSALPLESPPQVTLMVTRRPPSRTRNAGRSRTAKVNPGFSGPEAAGARRGSVTSRPRPCRDLSSWGRAA